MNEKLDITTRSTTKGILIGMAMIALGEFIFFYWLVPLAGGIPNYEQFAISFFYFALVGFFGSKYTYKKMDYQRMLTVAFFSIIVVVWLFGFWVAAGLVGMYIGAALWGVVVLSRRYL